MRVLKKLFLGDVVAKGTTRQLRKLTTEKPQEESIVGTWRLNPNSFDWGEYYPFPLLKNEDIQGKCHFITDKDTHTLLFTNFSHVSFGKNGHIGFTKFYTDDERPKSELVYPYQSMGEFVGWGAIYRYKEGDTLYNYSPILTDEQQQQCCIIEITYIGTSEKALIFAELLRKNATRVEEESIVGTWVIKENIPEDAYQYLETWQVDYTTSYIDSNGEIQTETYNQKYISITRGTTTQRYCLSIASKTFYTDEEGNLYPSGNYIRCRDELGQYHNIDKTSTEGIALRTVTILSDNINYGTRELFSSYFKTVAEKVS